MSHFAFVCVLFAAGCLEPGAYRCGDQTCPAGTVCDETNVVCLTPAQATVCKDENIAAGKPCNADGTAGICTSDLYCEPGCGDGVTDPDEECDDGNFGSHDGCSSGCAVEVMTWIPVTDSWTGVTQQSAAYHAGLQRLVLLGGLGDAGMRDQIWQRDPTRHDEIEGGWRHVTNAFPPTERPSARYGASMAYDPVRDVIVLFGGAMSTTTAVRLDDTWEYATAATTVDGERVGTWRKVTTPVAPTARYLASMAFDAGIGKIVMFGGLGGLDETWTYDGTWTKLAPATSPFGRYRAAMAYDATRGKLVMYGGRSDGKTWEFDGATWTSLTLTTNPGTRNEASLVYDPVRGKLVLFGGSTTGGVGQDTWTYDGTWQQVSGAIAPYGRRSAQLVSETGFDRLVLVGGASLSDTVGFDDVWKLDANGWSEVTPRFAPARGTAVANVFSPLDGALLRVGGATSPLRASFETWLFDGKTWVHGTDAPVDRYSQGLAYDSMRDRFVMASGSCTTDQAGCDPSTYNSSETYVLDRASKTWSLLPSAVVPTAEARDAFAMIYDPVHDEIVGFGGRVNLNLKTFTTTLVFDGTVWSTRVTAKHPAATVAPAATWDPVRGEIILFDSDGVTWVYRDREWVDIIAADPARPGRSASSMAYDPFRDRFLLIGGDTASGVTLDDVWELDPVAQQWTRLFISGVTPLPRRSFVFSMLPPARAMMLNGGTRGGAAPSDETWLLKFVSTTPDEDCTNVVDDDGDLQGDTEDPDCDPPPP